MYICIALSGLLCLFAVPTTAIPSIPAARRSTDSKIALYLNGANFDLDYLQSLELSYANASAYVGRIIDKSYAEPLVLSNLDGEHTSISFASVHQSTEGLQQMYVVPGDSEAVGFTLPGENAPLGASATGFSFGSTGELLHAGINRFFVCQDDALAPLNTYQIFWNAAGQPLGWTCQGPVNIQAGNA